MIDTVRAIVTLTKPSGVDSTVYTIFTLGRDLWRDNIATNLASWYAGFALAPMILSLVGGVPGTIAGSLWEFFRGKVGSINRTEMYPFQWKDRDGNIWTADAGYNPYSKGIKTCERLLGDLKPGELKIIPGAEIKRYGFKPDYYQNTHHMVAMFFYGFAGGGGVGELINKIYEGQTSNNPSDIYAGNTFAALGGSFSGHDWVSLPLVGAITSRPTIAPLDLPDVIQHEVYLP